MTAVVLTEVQGRVGIIRINRPEALNALNDDVVNGIGAAVDAFEADENIGCMVLTGSEKAFAAGPVGKRHAVPRASGADNPCGQALAKVKNGGIVDEKGIAACAPVRRTRLHFAAGCAVFPLGKKRGRRLRCV